MPPNMLKAKAGGGLGGIDVAAMKRAEVALESLKMEFSDWLLEDIKTLLAAQIRYISQPDATARLGLMRAAHDIKGQAATFHYPLIARIAGSLARLTGEIPEAVLLPIELVEAHVNAIQAIHRHGDEKANEKLALTLCNELEARVEDLLSEQSKS